MVTVRKPPLRVKRPDLLEKRKDRHAVPRGQQHAQRLLAALAVKILLSRRRKTDE